MTTSSENILWRHKFRTPRKEKKSKTLSWSDSKPAKRSAIEFTSHSYDRESNEEANRSSEERRVPITYEVMRSIVVALSYVEEKLDFNLNCQSESILLFLPTLPKCDDDIRKIEALRKVILDECITPFDTFAKLKDASIICAAVKAAIMSCEPIVPEQIMSVVVLNTSKDIQNLLSQLPQLNLLLFITLLQHACKVVKAQSSSEHLSKGLLNEVACGSWDLVVSKSTVTGAWYQFRKRKSRRRIMKALIRYFLFEKSTSMNSPLKSEPTREIGDGISSDDISAAIATNNFHKGEKLCTIEDFIDSRKKDVDYSPKSPMPYKAGERPDYEMDFRYGEQIKSFENKMDDMKKEALHQMRHDVNVMKEERCRINVAEVILKNIMSVPGMSI